MNWKPITVIAILALAGACQSPNPSNEKPLPSPTRLATIAVAEPDGAVVVLADRTTWIVEPEDRGIVQKWRSADLVEAIARSGSSTIEFPSILTNQETGSRVRAKQGADFGG